MRVDLGRGDVAITEHLLDCPDVMAAFEEVGGEAVSESMGGRALAQPGAAHSFRPGTLDYAFV